MRKLKHLVLVAVVFTAFSSTAQQSKVESVRMMIEDPDPSQRDLRECKRYIDEAYIHPKTSTSQKMYLYRGAVYYEIAADSVLSKEFPDALMIAAEMLFKCKDIDPKSDWGGERCDFYLLNVASRLFNAGVNEFQHKNFDKAILYYMTTLRIIPYDKKGDLKTININEDLVYQYSYYAAMANKDNAKTKEYITKLVERNFNDPNIYTALAKVYLEEKDTAGALGVLSKGRERFPAIQDLMNMELDIYLRTGKTDLLLKKLEDAIAADDQNKIYYFARASTYEKLDKPELAEKDYLKAMEIDPEYYDAIFNMGVLQVNKARPLIEQLQKVYKKVEQDAIEVEIKKVYTEALKYFEKCLELIDPKNKSEKRDLLDSMQHLYKTTGNTEKEAEMKKQKEEIPK